MPEPFAVARTSIGIFIFHLREKMPPSAPDDLHSSRVNEDILEPKAVSEGQGSEKAYEVVSHYDSGDHRFTQVYATDLDRWQAGRLVTDLIGLTLGEGECRAYNPGGELREITDTGISDALHQMKD